MGITHLDSLELSTSLTVAGVPITGLSLAPRIITEIPAGITNGINSTFTLSKNPLQYSDILYLNGIRIGPGMDYALTSNIITMTIPPLPADGLLITYNF